MYEIITGKCRLHADFDWYPSPEHPNYDADLPDNDTILRTLHEAMDEAVTHIDDEDRDLDVSILTASSDTKGSFHLQYKHVWFHTHEHMRYWVQDLTASWADSDTYVLRKASTKNEVLLDCSVYSKNQNWRLPYNAKLGSDRLLIPVGDGCWRDWIVTDCFNQGRQFITYERRQKVVERTSTARRPRVTTRVGRPQSDAYQTLADAEWPEPLSTPIDTLDLLALLQAVVPTQTMTRDLYINISMAAKNAGVQYTDFMQTHHSRWSDSSGGWQRMTHARWRGLNNHTGHTLGKPFLTAALFLLCYQQW